MAYVHHRPRPLAKSQECALSHNCIFLDTPSKLSLGYYYVIILNEGGSKDVDMNKNKKLVVVVLCVGV